MSRMQKTTNQRCLFLPGAGAGVPKGAGAGAAPPKEKAGAGVFVAPKGAEAGDDPNNPFLIDRWLAMDR